jgi:hypothetical protein
MTSKQQHPLHCLTANTLLVLQDMNRSGGNTSLNIVVYIQQNTNTTAVGIVSKQQTTQQNCQPLRGTFSLSLSPFVVHFTTNKTNKQTNSVALSPRTNYAD